MTNCELSTRPVTAVTASDRRDRGVRLESLTPARIMEVGMAFWPAKTLLSAVELGLFTAVGRRSDDWK